MLVTIKTKGVLDREREKKERGKGKEGREAGKATSWET